jgi:hypothetical protein
MFAGIEIRSKIRLSETARTLLLFGGLSGLAFALLSAALSLSVSPDAASFLVVAQRWLEGYWPYVGTFDNKPLLFYILMLPAYLLSLAVGPALALALNWAAWCGLLGVALRALLRQLGVSTQGALFAALAVTVLSANPRLCEGGGYSETPAAVFLVLACFWALRPGGRAAAAAGLSLAIATTISLTAIPFSALVAVSLWLGHRQAGDRVKAGLTALASAGLLIVLVVIILALVGALGAAIYDVLDYNRAYIAVRPCSLLVYNGWPCGYTPAANLLAIGGSVIAWLGFVLLGLALLRRQASSVLLSALWLVLFLVPTLLQGRLAPHYALIAVVPLAIFAGLGLETLTTWRHRLIKLALLGLLAWLAIFINLALAQNFVLNNSWIGVDNQRSGVLADWLTRNTNADTPYWLWGSDTTSLYLLLPRRPLDPNINLYGLITPGWATPQMGTQLACSLAGQRGLVIEDTANPEMPGLETPGSHPLWANVLDPVRALVRDHYHQIGRIDQFIIYAPLPGPVTLAGCP